MPTSAGPDIIQNGLVLALDASDRNSYPGTGTSWTDISGNGNTGTLVNGPVFNTGSLGNIVFDGTNDYVNGSIPTMTAPFTLEYFGKFNNTTQVNYEYFGMAGTATAASTCLTVSKIGSLFGNSIYTGNMYIYGGGNYATLTDINLATTNWQHLIVVATTSSPYVLVYKNSIQGNILTGIPNTEQILSPINILNGTYRLGNFSANNTWWLNGNLAVHRIYNRALSSSEILQNYNATRTKFGL